MFHFAEVVAQFSGNLFSSLLSVSHLANYILHKIPLFIIFLYFVFCAHGVIEKKMMRFL